MNDYNNGEIWGWNGGECPVHPESEVMFWFRGMSGCVNDAATAHSWQHRKYVGDIIAFQVTKPYVEPKVIWVNEYHHGGGLVYTSEEEAKSDAGKAVKRISVKYVEAKE